MTANDGHPMITIAHIEPMTHGAAELRVKFTNCSQFLSYNYFGFDFHFFVIFLLIGKGQLDNDVLKNAKYQVLVCCLTLFTSSFAHWK